MNDWAKTLLADVAREVAQKVSEDDTFGTDEMLAVLERRLLGLLEAGQAMDDNLNSQHGTQWPKCPECALQRQWRAAKAVASEGKKSL